MKNSKFTFAILFILSAFSINAQTYGNMWYFGTKAGIDFNKCTPVPLTDGMNEGFEGCSTVCDSTGAVMFYTNSDKVWNKNHQVMPNGLLVNANKTLSQVLIVPKPQSKTIFYIFTTETQGGVVTPTALQYHTVDMTLNGGLGDLLNKNNVLNANKTTEQVAATHHLNGTDIWVMTHEYLNNNFKAYLITPAGLNTTPVVSMMGSAQATCNSNTNARGEIKFSPNGNKVAFNANGVGGFPNTNLLELFDFDKSTGMVSNPILLPFKQGEFGLSFSPDNSKLYGATWKALNFTINDSNYVYQFDLSSGVSSTIINSRTILAAVPVPNSFGSLKIGPNGKIYIGKYNATALDVINNPNLPGVSCNYVQNGFSLGGKTGMYGLNNYIEYTNYTVHAIPSLTVTSTKVTCPGQPVTLTSNGAATYSWSSGPTTSTLSVTPTITTTYTVSGFSSVGCSVTSVFTQTVMNCTSVDDIIENKNDVQLFPNPAKGVLNIKSENNIELIEILNQYGQVIYKETPDTNNYSLTIEEQGLFYLRVYSNKEVVMRKVILGARE